jgi:hypothetical protein
MTREHGLKASDASGLVKAAESYVDGMEPLEAIPASEVRAMLQNAFFKGAWFSRTSGVPEVYEDWVIDRSTGRPILTYKRCSVIEAEQAEYVMRLVTAAGVPTQQGEQP